MSKRHIKEERLFIVIFVSLVVFFLAFINMLENKEESSKVFQKIVFDEENKSDMAFIVNGEIDRSRLEKISQMSYEELKQEFGLKKDFYMFFEDGNGNIIPIGNRTCIGSPKIAIAGQRCG